MHGAWLTLVGYGAAFVVFMPFARLSVTAALRCRADVLALIFAAGWTNLAFVLAPCSKARSCGGIAVLPVTDLGGIAWRWLLGERLSRSTWVMLGLGLGGALVMLGIRRSAARR